MKYRLGQQPTNFSLWPNSVDKHLINRNNPNYDVLALDSDTLIWRTEFNAITEQPAAIHKLYFKRGIFSWVREHLFAFRVEREFRALFYLQEKDVPASIPLGWSKGKSKRLGGRFEVLSTQKIPNSIPFSDFWFSDRFSLADKLATLRAVILLIAQMHQVGFYHGALYARNILLSPQEDGSYAPFIIDVPRAVIFNKSLVGDKLAEVDLSHFVASIRKNLTKEVLLDALLTYGLKAKIAEDLVQKFCQQKAQNKHTRNWQRGYSVWREFFIS